MDKNLRGGRINRINPMIQQIVSDCFLNSSDPVLNKATVTYVSTSPDLKKTTVLVSSIENNKSSLNNSLARSKQKIQKVLSKEMKTKYVPSITFELDNSFDDIDSCLLYTSPSPRDGLLSRMPSSA